MCKKAIFFTFIIFTIIAYAKDIAVNISDNTFSIENDAGWEYYRKTVANNYVTEWTPGDSLTLMQDGKVVTKVYSSYDRFVVNGTSGSGGTSLGGGSGYYDGGGYTPGGGYFDNDKCGVYESCVDRFAA